LTHKSLSYTGKIKRNLLNTSSVDAYLSFGICFVN
jgi:hypothetical protein